MTRTAIILFAIMLFVTWYVHVINRAGLGSGARSHRFASDTAFTATVSGALYVIIVTWSLFGSYMRHVRGQANGFIAVLGPPFLSWTASCIVAFITGVLLAEFYCLADERAFRREVKKRMATKAPEESRESAPLDEVQQYSRVRWWPAGSQDILGG